MYQECPNEDCTPRLFQLGDAPEDRVLDEKSKFGTRRTPGPGETICPYCGQKEADDNFVAGQDIATIRRFIDWAVRENVGDHLEDWAHDLNRSLPKGGFASIEVKAKRKRKPRPVTIREDLLRDLICNVCERNYGVYAIGLYCPDCGAINVQVHFRREVEIVRRQTELAEEVKSAGDAELAYRLMGNAHEDVLTAFETALKTIYRHLVRQRLPDDVSHLDAYKAIGNRFQNVRRGRELFAKIGLDLYEYLDEEELETIRLNVEKRHVIGHNISLADNRYSTLAHDGKLGQNIDVTNEDIDQFATLCGVVIDHLATEIALQ